MLKLLFSINSFKTDHHGIYHSHVSYISHILYIGILIGLDRKWQKQNFAQYLVSYSHARSSSYELERDVNYFFAVVWPYLHNITANGQYDILNFPFYSEHVKPIPGIHET